MNHDSNRRRFVWERLVSASLVALVLSGCPAANGPVHLRTALHAGAVPAFGKLITDYNGKHPTSPIEWKNVATESELNSDTAADPWVIVSAKTARGWQNRQSFTSSLSPKLTSTLIKPFADLRQSAADGTMLPLLGVQPVMIADITAIAKGGGGFPVTIGEMLKRSQKHRQAVGRYLFAPAFGDAENLLRFIHSQGAKVTTASGNVVFPGGELETLLQPWVDAYRQGDLPAASLDWSEVDAARQMVRGVADITLGGLEAVDAVAARPDKVSRRFNFYRPFTGVVEEQWVEPIGLVSLGSGSVSLGVQNMVAFLMSKAGQHALADGYQAVPVVAEPMKAYTTVSNGVSVARMTYLLSVVMHGADGFPLLPLDPHRSVLAEAMRRALKDAVAGMPVRDAVHSAETWFNQQVGVAAK